MSLPINSRITDTTDVAPTLQAAKSENRGGTEGPLVFVSGRCSPASAASTTDSTELGFDTSSSVNRILGAEKSSPPGGPESPSTTTCATWEDHDWKVISPPYPPWSFRPLLCCRRCSMLIGGM